MMIKKIVFIKIPILNDFFDLKNSENIEGGRD